MSIVRIHFAPCSSKISLLGILPVEFELGRLPLFTKSPQQQQASPHGDSLPYIFARIRLPPGFALPGHTPFVLARFEDGTLGTLPMKTDTLIVDLKENQVIQVARVTLMRTHPVRALELRMKLNRDAMPNSLLIYKKGEDAE